jgi:hypothetical protein
MGKHKQKSNTQSFPSWTNKALQSYLTQRKVIWHSWMKKSVLVKLCQEHRVIQSILDTDNSGRRSGRDRPVRHLGSDSGQQVAAGASTVVMDRQEEVMDTTHHARQEDSQEPPFPPQQMMFLQQFAKDVVQAAVKAAKESTPSSQPRLADTSAVSGAAVIEPRRTEVGAVSHRGYEYPGSSIAPPYTVPGTPSNDVAEQQEPRSEIREGIFPPGFPNANERLPGAVRNGENATLFGKTGISINSLPAQEP